MIEHISSFFRNLNETAGLNFIVFYDDYEFSRFLEGALISLRLMAFSILLSLVIGVLGAWAQTSKSAIIRVAVDAYIQAFRNTPPMIQLLFFYFGLGAFTPAVDMGILRAHYLFFWVGCNLAWYLWWGVQRRDIPGWPGSRS